MVVCFVTTTQRYAKLTLFAEIGRFVERVSAEALDAEAPDGRKREDAAEIGACHRGDLIAGERGNCRRGVKLGDGCWGGSAVVGAAELTAVAAVDPRAEGEPRGELAAILNGEVGETAAGVETAVGADGSGGTGADTPAAGAAGAGARLVGGEGRLGDDGRKEEI